RMTVRSPLTTYSQPPALLDCRVTRDGPIDSGLAGSARIWVKAPGSVLRLDRAGPLACQFDCPRASAPMGDSATMTAATAPIVASDSGAVGSAAASPEGVLGQRTGRLRTTTRPRINTRSAIAAVYPHSSSAPPSTKVCDTDGNLASAVVNQPSAESDGNARATAKGRPDASTSRKLTRAPNRWLTAICAWSSKPSCATAQCERRQRQ